MVCETKLSLNNCLSLFALINALSEELWVLLKEEERQTCDKLFLVCGNHLHDKLSILEIIVKDFNWAPNVLFIFVNWRKSMCLVRPSLAVVNPLLDGLIFLPSVVTGECFNTGNVWISVEDLILLLENL